MPIAIAYWILMLLLLVFGAIYVYPSGTFIFGINFVLMYLLFVLIGIKDFGRPLT
jgi:hypothetical protein